MSALYNKTFKILINIFDILNNLISNYEKILKVIF